jgi:tetraacyldisaccharide 4'-kinase
MTLESYVLEVMDGKRKGKTFLHMLSYLYRGGVALRNLAYDAKIFSAKKVAAPVISVGNIVAGGTGKTPLVKMLAEELSQTRKVAILSRGYKSHIENSGDVLCIHAETPVDMCGDEPFWLARSLPQAAVWVGKNRAESATQAIQKGAEILFLDDGMQYRDLHRDIEIVVMDGEDLFGKGYFLPRGLLRDTPKRLKRADLIVINDAKCHKKVKETLSLYTKAPILFVRMKIQEDLTGKRVGVFCAIGKPDRFVRSLKDCGADVVATLFKPDHDPFHPEELALFAKTSGADTLVCTQKDYVKLPHRLSSLFSILPIEGEFEIVSGKEEWQRIKKGLL